MADEQAQAVADAPEQAAEAPDTSQDTAPTPVREGMPSSRSEVREQGLEATFDALNEKYGGGEEEPPETDETAAEAPEATEGEQAPEVAAEDAVRMDSGPDAEDLPEGWFYDSQGALKDDDGRYVSPQRLQPEEAAVASGEEASPSTSDDPDAPSVPEGFEELDLPQGHPLRDRGEEQVPIPSKETLVEQFGERGEQVYNYLRHGLNAGAENRQLRQQFQQLQNQLARLQAEREVEQSEEGKQWDPRDNPQLRQEIEDIRQAYGDERAEQYIEALKAKRQEIVSRKARESLSERQEQQRAVQFIQTVNQHAPNHFPVWAESGELGQRLQPLYQRFATLVEAGQEPADPARFIEWAWWESYAQDPRVQRKAAVLAQQTDQEQQSKAKQEATEERKREERERLKEAAQRRENNPHAKLAGQQTGKSTPEPDDETPDYKGMSKGRMMDDVKKRLGLA